MEVRFFFFFYPFSSLINGGLNSLPLCNTQDIICQRSFSTKDNNKPFVRFVPVFVFVCMYSWMGSETSTALL